MVTGSPVLVLDHGSPSRFRKLDFTWTSSAGGVVITDAIRATGLFMGIETAPGAVTPTAYNVQVRRGGSTTAFADMLNGSATSGGGPGGIGTLRSTTLPEFARPVDGNGNGTTYPCRDDDIYVTIDTAGSVKTGSFSLFFLTEG